MDLISLFLLLPLTIFFFASLLVSCHIVGENQSIEVSFTKMIFLDSRLKDATLKLVEKC